MAAPGFRFVAQLVLDQDFEDLRERAQAAERAGFGAVLVPDHFYTGEQRISGKGIGESWTTVAALAAHTQRIRVGGSRDVQPLPAPLPDRPDRGDRGSHLAGPT